MVAHPNPQSPHETVLEDKITRRYEPAGVGFFVRRLWTLLSE